MNLQLIMTYSLKEMSLYNRENNTSIKGSWLHELAKKYRPINTDSYISLVGLDEQKRIEISVSIGLFNELKNDTTFIMKAENLRRLRTNDAGITILEHLCFHINHFDNDLDKNN